MLEEEEIQRIRIPKKGEVLGIALVMLGAGKISVKCEDGNVRLSRIAGRIRKELWIRVGDVVLGEPWIVQTHERADITWIYTKTQANWLKRKGYIKNSLE